MALVVHFFLYDNQFSLAGCSVPIRGGTAEPSLCVCTLGAHPWHDEEQVEALLED